MDSEVGQLAPFTQALNEAFSGRKDVRITADDLPGDLQPYADAFTRILQDMAGKAAETGIKTAACEHDLYNATRALRENPFPMLFLSPDLKVVDWNEAFIQVSGYREETLRTMTFSDLKIRKVQGPSVQDSIRQKTRVKGTAEVEFPAGTFVMERYSIPVIGQDGTVERVLVVYNDITELTARMQDIERMKARADRMIKENPLAIALLAGDKSRTDINREYERMWRGGYDELMKKKLYDFDITVLDGEDFYACFTTRKRSFTETLVRWPDGVQKYLRLDAIPVLDDKGEIEMAFYIWTDQTEQKLKMQEVQQLREQTEQIIEEAPVPMLLWNSDLTIRRTNRAFLDLTGYSKADASRLTVRDFVYLEQTGEGVDATIRSKKRSEGRITIRFPSGTFTLERFNIPLLDAGGGIESVLSVYIDITKELKLIADAEDKAAWYESILDSIPFPVSVTDLEMRWTFINRPTEAFLDTSRAEVMGKHCSSWNAAICNTADCGVTCLRKGKTTTFFNQSGGNFRVDTSYVKNAKGENVGHVEVVQDITSIARLSDYLKNEVDKVAENLERLAQGDLALTSDVAAPDQYTREAHDNFVRINQSLDQARNAIEAMTRDAVTLSEAAVAGRLATRADLSRHRGEYRAILEGVNKTLDAVMEPVNEALRVSKEFAATNFAARVDPSLKVAGDWVTLRDALNNIGSEVSKAISLITSRVTDLASSAEEANASVEEVASGSSQVSKNVTKVSSNMEHVRGSAGQVMRAMEDLSVTVQSVATKSESVSRLAMDANDLSKKGAGLAKNADNGMAAITKNTAQVAEIVDQIKGQMTQIGKIVGLISDLASQTNLLALNAAIEAARAGDAGRGFAVVATEVKSLAQESRASAENIASMIGSLEKMTLEASDAMHESGKTVEEGSRALSETLEVFNRIVGSISQITTNVEEVASASQEQAASVEEITASVNEVNDLVEQTGRESMDAAAASEEATASLDQIAKIVGNLNVIVEDVSKEMRRFRV